MSLTNKKVAERFVNGIEGSGSNTISRHANMPNTAREENRVVESALPPMAFVSYKTVVACMIADRLFIDTKRYSNSTARQVSYVRAAWNARYPDRQQDLYLVPDVYGGGSRANVEYYLKEARECLGRVVAPRVKMSTRIGAWGQYLYYMEYADKLLRHVPSYGTPTTPEFMAEKYDPINRAREGLNPTGLGEFDNDMLLRVKALAALEGEGT